MSQVGQDQVWRGVGTAARLGDQLFDRLTQLIERGEFPEGSRLPAESELAERFGVSRPVIREALSRLRSAGTIVSRRGSGSFVQSRGSRATQNPLATFGTLTSLAQVRHCYVIRTCIESEAAFYAAENRSPGALDGLRSALDRLETAIATGQIGMDADYEFHSGVARASGNVFLVGVMEAMRTPIEFTIDLARSLALRHPMDHLLTVQAEHVRIFEAIENGDAETARISMRTHVENSCRRVFEGPPEVPAA